MFIKKYKHLILPILITLFIFINSLIPGDMSSNQSGLIVNILYPPFKNLVSIETFTFIIRKLAHFTEYMILGFSLIFLYRKVHKHYYLLFIINGTLVALVDEVIQIFVPGRAGMILDVLLDMSGVLFSIGVYLLVTVLFSKDNTKNFEI